MALINPLRGITLMSFSKWDAWDEVLKTKAKNHNLWGYINLSINNKKLLEKPIKPEILDFLKYIYNNR